MDLALTLLGIVVGVVYAVSMIIYCAAFAVYYLLYMTVCGLVVLFFMAVHVLTWPFRRRSKPASE